MGRRRLGARPFVSLLAVCGLLSAACASFLSEGPTTRATSQRCPATGVDLQRLLKGFKGVALVGGSDGPYASFVQDFDGGPGMTLDTIFDIGSVASSFTAAAILRLQEEGRLSVSDEVGDHVVLPVPLSRVTLDQLLTHTAGLPRMLLPDVAPVTKEKALARIASAELARPGRFSYSDSSYTLLAAVVESVSGGSFRRFVASRLLAPAGMTSTYWYGDRLDPARVANGFVDKFHRGDAGTQAPASWATFGSGGMLSTALDLRSWVSALKAGKILPPEALEAMLEPRVEKPDRSDFYSAAYGWEVGKLPGGERVAGISGTTQHGFSSDLRVFLERDAIAVVLGNSSSFDAHRAARAIEPIVGAGCR